jgi:SAM-dependent methyltransferase
MAPVGDAACILCGAPQSPAFTKRGYTFARCGGCGLVSLQPLPDAAAIARHHDDSYRAGHYAVFAAAEDVRAAIAADRLARLRPVLPAGRWLDVGCSTGAFLVAARAAGNTVEGVELSAPAAEQARARGVAVHQISAETFEPAAPYDAITAFDVVEHLPDPLAFVRRAAGWLRPGGAIALTVPNAASVVARLLGRAWFYYAPPDHVHYFTPSTVTRLLASGGLADVRVGPLRKPVTVRYALGQASLLSRRLAASGERLAAALPDRVGAWSIRVPLGEIVATARRGDGP